MSSKSPLSQRAAAGRPSLTMAITAKAKAKTSEGKDVVSFAAGEPDFRTPDHICEAAKKAIDDGLHGYLPNAGMPALRVAVSERLAADIGVTFAPEQVLISPGGKYSLYLAFQAMIDPGDEVLLPSPYWVSYPDMVELAGGTTTLIPTNANNGFKLTVEMIEPHITPKTKLLILNSPSNPSGAVIPPSEIARIGALLERHGLYCISDEIYDKLVYGANRHCSIASVSDYCYEHTIVCNGCSKAYAMTGWRIGYAAGRADVLKAMSNIQSQSTSNACSIAQAAALAAVGGPQDCVGEMRRAFDVRRSLIVERLNAIEGVTCAEPGGAFYVLPDVSGVLGRTLKGKVVDTPFALCDLALDESLVACVPGEAFGTDKHIRLSYATSEAQIEEGCARLKDLIEG